MLIPSLRGVNTFCIGTGTTQTSRSLLAAGVIPVRLGSSGFWCDRARFEIAPASMAVDQISHAQ